MESCKGASLDLSSYGLAELHALQLDDAAGSEDGAASPFPPPVERHLLTRLSLARNSLADVCGLQLLPSLAVLDLSNNQLRDLQPLQALTGLQRLDVSDNRLSSLAGISGLCSLVSVDAGCNRLAALPCLTALTALTQLSLRHNQLQAVTAPTAAAGPAGACVARANSQAPALPSCLRRLSLAGNSVQHVGALAPLRRLPLLLELWVDCNPCTQHDGSGGDTPGSCAGRTRSSSSGSSSSSKYEATRQGCSAREAVLLTACGPALLALDGQPVTPAERMLLLAASRHHDSAGKHAPPDSDAQLSVEGQQLETPSAASPAADGVVRACEPASGGTAAQAHSKCHQQQLAALVRAAGSTCLQHAARTCGVDVGVGSAHDCSDQTHGVVATGTAAARATSRAGAAAVLASPSGSTACWDAEGVFTAFISEEELRAKYLWAERARLAARTRAPAAADASSAPQPAAPGAQLSQDGRACVLAGAAALQFLSEAACASVQHVTLAHMPHTAVLGALPALQRHQRLRALTLDSVEGLSLLPQLHALLPLLPASGAGAGGGGSGARLRHLSIAGSCPICGLVLLRPYVAFRFAGLGSFNGVPVTPADVAAAAALFGPLESALAAALGQPLQRAALVAAGVVLPPPTTAPPQQPAPLGADSCVSAVLAQVRGRLRPSATAAAAGSAAAEQVLQRAAAAQARLAEFEDVTWPGLVEAATGQVFGGHDAHGVAL